MNRRLIGIIAGAAIAALPLTACSDSNDESATAVCADANGVRLPDTACSDSSSGNQWLWFLIGSQIGGIGSNLSGGSYNRPSNVNHYYYGGAPSTGGSVPRSGHFSGGSTTAPKPSVKPSASPVPTATASTPTASSKPPATSAKPSKPSVKTPAKPNLAKPKAPAAKPKVPSAPKVKPPAPKPPKIK